MTGKTELNSTERLLSTIRGAEAPPLFGVEAAEPAKAVPNPGLKSSSHRKISGKRSTVGVYIEPDQISLALVEGKSSSGKLLTRWVYASIPEGMDIQNEAFPSFLKRTLSEFIGKAGSLDIWTTISSKDFKIRTVVIPDLPAAKKANAAFWGLKKELDIVAENEIFDFEALDEFFDGGIKKQKILAFSCPREEVNHLRQVFAKAGYPLTGITAIPFALQNFVRTGATNEELPSLFGMVHVAREFTEITCFSDSAIILVRNIKTGAHSLEDEYDISSMDRLAGKIARTNDYCSQQYAANEPVTLNLVFGETDDSPMFMEHVSAALSSRVVRLDPFQNHLAQPGILVPPSRAKARAGVIPAFGIALSVNALTPNFLYTHVHKTKDRKYRRMNLGIGAGFLVCLAVCLGIYFWQASVLAKKTSQLASIDTQLSAYEPRVTQELIASLISKAKACQELESGYAAFIVPLAVINEVCTLTPDTITLSSLELDTGADEKAQGKTNNAMAKSVEAQAPAKSDKNLKPARVVLIRGVVKGESTSLESALTGYILRLGDSPILGSISLVSKEAQKLKNNQGDALIFNASMEVL
ncbi:MAG: hypothetical protein V1793_11880 [Pseudomonadota bacterium]